MEHFGAFKPYFFGGSLITLSDIRSLFLPKKSSLSLHIILVVPSALAPSGAGKRSGGGSCRKMSARWCRDCGDLILREMGHPYIARGKYICQNRKSGFEYIIHYVAILRILLHGAFLVHVRSRQDLTRANMVFGYYSSFYGRFWQVSNPAIK